MRKALISFREDFNNFLSNYLQVGKENYILSNIDNVMVIFRDKSLGDFSDVENVAINKWIQPYFDISKRPLIAEYLNGYKIDGNRIIIDIKDSQMYANGGGVKHIAPTNISDLYDKVIEKYMQDHNVSRLDAMKVIPINSLTEQKVFFQLNLCIKRLRLLFQKLYHHFHSQLQNKEVLYLD